MVGDLLILLSFHFICQKNLAVVTSRGGCMVSNHTCCVIHPILVGAWYQMWELSLHWALSLPNMEAGLTRLSISHPWSNLIFLFLFFQFAQSHGFGSKQYEVVFWVGLSWKHIFTYHSSMYDLLTMYLALAFKTLARSSHLIREIMFEMYVQVMDAPQCKDLEALTQVGRVSAGKMNA